MNKSLAEWLHYLETLHPKTIDLGLDRVKQVAQSMQLLSLQPSFIITVAGTNGKGTSVALLEKIFLAADYRTGTYTSPHLIHYNERTKINGLPVTDADLCRAFTRIEQARGSISLSYFEFGTLAALCLFKQAALDIIILEVGLGGRLDAVNMLDADIALITTIALDHMDYLGDNREAIGQEKAGVMRANKPVVYGEPDIPMSVCRYAQQIQAPLYQLNKDFSYQQINKTQWQWQSTNKLWMELPLPKIPLQNAAAVLQVIKLLPSYFNITEKNIIAALQTVQVAGRFQVLPNSVLTILDVAHNPAAAVYLAAQLQKLPVKGRTYAVIGMLADKDYQSTVSALLPEISAWFVGSLAVPRGLSAEKLGEVLSIAGAIKVNAYITVTAAYQAAQCQAKVDDRIIVFGSFYTVAEVMSFSLDKKTEI